MKSELPMVLNTKFRFMRNLLITMLLFLQAGCIMPNRPTGERITIPEYPGQDSISITVVRASQIIGYYPLHYIAIDGTYVAALKSGQYTKIPISKGSHVLSARRYIGGLMLWPFGGSPETRNPPSYTANCEFECYTNDMCFFGIRANVEDIEISQVERLDGEFSLQGKTFVKPGYAK